MTAEDIKPPTLQALIISLYKNAFPKVAAYIHKNGGSLEESKDIFQDALVIYYERSREGINLRSDEQTYLFGICKNLWYKKYHENKLQQSLELTQETKIKKEPQPVISGDILRFIEASGKKCLDLLQAFYYDQLNMKELAARFGFSGERSATAQKYKCLEKVRTVIQTRSLKKEDFYE